jgi:hypothetical protein
MKQSIIVWDLETVPDLDGFAAANDLVGKSDINIREAIGEKLPKHITTLLSASGLSLRTGRAITGRWVPSARLTCGRGRRKS